MEEKIEDVLVKIGVPENVLGFDFIKEAVLILDRDGVCAKWICLYHEIGKKYGKTGGMVERGIRYALHATRKECKDKDVVNHYIGFTNTSNSNSISLLYRRIKREIGGMNEWRG